MDDYLKTLTTASGRENGLKGNALYNTEIDDMMKEYYNKGFVGTFAADQFDKIPINKKKENISFILNLNKLKDKEGHWVAVYLKPDAVYYYDSFGEEPKKPIMDNIKNILKLWKPGNVYQLKINRIKNQRNNSSTCGYFAMKFLKDIYDGKDFKEATGFKALENSMKGEKKLKQFIKEVKQFDYIKS